MTVQLQRAPVAVFGFNRVDHLRGTIESLAQCSGFHESPITIFVDGPRHEGDLPGVQAVRDYVNALQHDNVTAVIREQNLGLRKSIFQGVSALTEQYGRVIVLEDDFIVSPVILDYFDAALTKYADDPRVWNVVGYMYDVPGLKARDTALCLPYTHPWGWATWARAWRHFTLDRPVSEEVLASRAFKERFSLYGLADYATMLRMALNGKVNSWYVQWYYRMAQMGGVSIFPPQTYVLNSGIGDEKATHGSKLNPYHFLVPPAKLSEVIIKLPEELDIDYVAIDQMVASRDAKVQRLVIKLGEIKRMFKRR